MGFDIEIIQQFKLFASKKTQILLNKILSSTLLFYTFFKKGLKIN